MSKLPCKVIEDLCPLYVDDVCSDESKNIIEEHILECENCKAKLYAMRQTLSINPPLIKENITEKKLFKKVKRIWIISMVIVLIFSSFLFIFLSGHTPELFQEGNPLPYTKSFIQLIGFKDYVNITNVGESPSGEIRFLTKKDDSKELFNYIKKEYQMKFTYQMGSGYIFLNEASSLGLGSETYMKFYTIWTVGTVHYKINNNIFSKNIFDGLSEINIDLWHNDEAINISNKQDFQVIYNSLSNLTLTEVANVGSENVNYMIINLVTKDETISFTLFPDEICIDGKCYHIDKDSTSLITQIAVQNHFENSN